MGANVVLIGCIGVFGPFPFSRGYTLEVCLHINMVAFFHNHGHCVQENNSLFGVPPSMAQVMLGRTI